jgi:uncharacterized membrane protein YphA (DoxX/SURF4 family)
MKAFQMFIACIGRLCIGGPCLLAGIYLILNWSGSLFQLREGLARFCNFHLENQGLTNFVNLLISWSTILAGVAVFCLTIGGLLVFFGVKTRFGAFCLSLVMIGWIFIFHPFWHFPPEEKFLEMKLFMQHFALLGGLLTLLALGNGTSKKSVPKPEGK